jgi:hypothetical protein
VVHHARAGPASHWETRVSGGCLSAIGSNANDPNEPKVLGWTSCPPPPVSLVSPSSIHPDTCPTASIFRVVPISHMSLVSLIRWCCGDPVAAEITSLIRSPRSVFGRVVHGFEHIKSIGQLAVDDRDRPLSPVTIVHCGELELRRPAQAQTTTTKPPVSARGRGRSDSVSDRSESRSRSRSPPKGQTEDSDSEEEDRRRRERKKERRERREEKREKQERERKRDRKPREETEEELDAR